jgi:hypothetical protein
MACCLLRPPDELTRTLRGSFGDWFNFIFWFNFRCCYFFGHHNHLLMDENICTVNACEMHLLDRFNWHAERVCSANC